MKFFMCLVLLAVVAVHADEEAVIETEEAEASQPLPLILPSPQPLRPKPTLAPYKPIPRVIKPIQPTYVPLLTQKPKVYVLPSTARPLRPKPTLAPYKPIPRVIKPIQTTYKPLKVIPTVSRWTTIRPNYQNAQQSGAYIPWKESA